MHIKLLGGVPIANRGRDRSVVIVCADVLRFSVDAVYRGWFSELPIVVASEVLSGDFYSYCLSRNDFLVLRFSSGRSRNAHSQCLGRVSRVLFNGAVPIGVAAGEDLSVNA